MQPNDHDILIEFKAQTGEKLNHILVGMKELADGNNKRLDIVEKKQEESDKAILILQADNKQINQNSMDRYAQNREFAGNIKNEIMQILLDRTKESDEKFSGIMKINADQSKQISLMLKNMYIAIGFLTAVQIALLFIIKHYNF